MWDYTEEVMDHYRNPRNVGTIDNADMIGEAGSLACGDSLKLFIKLDGNKVVDAKFQTFGCGSAVAASSILTEMIIGKTLDEVKKITNKDIANEHGVFILSGTQLSGDWRDAETPDQSLLRGAKSIAD